MKQKKRQIITIWIANNKKFTTFKAFKRWLWHNLHTGETLEGFQIWEDTIFKRYNIKKTERRLLIEITYNLEQEQKTAAEYFYTQAQEKKVWEEVREQIVKSDVAEETKEAMIKKTGLENFNLMQAGIESITRQKLNSEQINYLRGQLAIGWANVAIGEKSVSNEADRIANDLMMGMKSYLYLCMLG